MLIAIALLTFTSSIHAEDAAAPSDEVLDAVQVRLDTFRIREDGKHHTPGPHEERTAKVRERIVSQIASLDAREIQSTGVLRLTALVLSDDDLRVLAQLTGIRSVLLGKCTITADGFAHIADAWAGSLTQLGLSYVDVQGGGSIAESMAKLDKLTWLAINKTSGIGIDAIRAVADHPIEMIDMNRPSGQIPAVELLELLETRFKTLRFLDLHHWQKFRQERVALYEERPEVKKQNRLERYFGVPEKSSE